MNDASILVGYSRFCNANSSENISVISEDVEFGYIVFALFVAIIGILGNTSILLTFFKKRHHANFYHLVMKKWTLTKLSWRWTRWWTWTNDDNHNNNQMMNIYTRYCLRLRWWTCTNDDNHNNQMMYITQDIIV